jgi:membrane glycosyltransferase
MDTVVDAGFRALPDEAPLAMPVQSLRDRPSIPVDQGAMHSGRLPSSPRGIAVRRLLVIGGAVILTGFGANEIYQVLAVNGPTPIAVVMLVLFVLLFAWIALSFTSAIAGFVSLVGGGGARLASSSDRPVSRTALLMPCYNEQPARIAAGLEAILASLAATGTADRFDLFILSDTTDPDIWIEEEASFLALRVRASGVRVYYRHRPKNAARKAGNIADWVSRFGGAYPQFLILDADSVMTGEILVRLVTAMEAHPDVGLIQTLPIITGGTTLFARLQQFAGRVYGPLIAHGIAWWHGAEGNYWGHNALIRTRAFADCAGLPELRGRKPFGGHILSHDFVEAALIRRGGWAVHMMPALAGSYEQGPPSLADLSIRDRRWCQGNLQHIAVLPARRLHWISRLHLLTGIGSYITAPLWLLFLLAGILIALQARFIPPEYFPAGKSLFPQWPVIDPVRAMWVFVGTMALLLLPKLLGMLAVVLNGPERRGCGGALRLAASVLLETVLAGLLAPVVMLTQTIDVVAILLGRDSGWHAQRRDDGSVPWRDTIRLYRRHTLLGILLGGGAWAVSASLALWMLPVVLGLALSVPLAALTARRDLGLALRRLGLLLTPEERSPPPVLAHAATSYQRSRGTCDDGGGSPCGEPSWVRRLLTDNALLAAHGAMLPPPRRPGIDPIDPAQVLAAARLAEARTLEAAWTAMTPQERMAILHDPTTLDRMVDLIRFRPCGRTTLSPLVPGA